MKYFLGITDIEQAKLRYRKLAKQLHPDMGGTAKEFQNMQNEYKTVLLKLQQKNKAATNLLQTPTQSLENEFLEELRDFAKVLIKKQVPQNYLKNKIHTTNSAINKELYAGIINLLHKF